MEEFYTKLVKESSGIPIDDAEEAKVAQIKLRINIIDGRLRNSVVNIIKILNHKPDAYDALIKLIHGMKSDSDAKVREYGEHLEFLTLVFVPYIKEDKKEATAKIQRLITHITEWMMLNDNVQVAIKDILFRIKNYRDELRKKESDHLGALLKLL